MHALSAEPDLARLRRPGDGPGLCHRRHHLLHLVIITIPFGLASFRIASYALWPFGRTAVPKLSAGLFTGLGNVIWLLVAGWGGSPSASGVGEQDRA